MKKRGFVSHINEESQVAEHMKVWCNRIFREQLDLFVSSLDMGPGGWLEQIRESLRASSFVFPLLSKSSIGMPWINFESGSAFMAHEVQLIPICHKDLTPAELVDPYSSFQAYDLRRPDSVTSLVRYLAQELNLDVPQADAEEFSQEIMRLDNVLYRCFRTFDELRSQGELREILADVQNPAEIQIGEIEIWDELELRARIYNNRVIEASGYTREAMGFNVYDIDVPEASKFLLMEFENSENSTSHDLDKFVKLNINRYNVKSSIKGQIHYQDSQFTVKGDGFFAFSLPSSVKYTGKMNLSMAFWRIELQGLLMKFYLA